MSLEPIEPRDIKDFQTQQAGRVRAFLERLAMDDDLLVRYINDRVTVLHDEVEDERLNTEDVALLLDSDYSRVYEVMSQGSAPQRWIVIWIV
ncbi:MAG: hypothetical protein E6G12_11665 [Actinobacteria bacterium]|nr:MAG: hypothetical protein E6G12_11665 [Actinomycetota bacterium]